MDTGWENSKPRSTNPRTHSKKQIDQIAKAIQRFGFTNPILIDDSNGIIGGHGRLETARCIGLDQVPTVRLSAMSEAEIRALPTTSLPKTQVGTAICWALSFDI
jgi:ParB-like chromosome segregation protein Spo0J